MKPRLSDRQNHALTLVELTVVIAVLALLAATLLPALSQHHDGRQRLDCINNLKQINLAYLLWAGDNHDHYPMEASVTNGGTKELMDGPDAWKTFLVMSNEVSTPKILLCPQDAERRPAATNFSESLKTHISYFISLDATVNSQKALLSGDDHFVISGTRAKPGVLNLLSNTPVLWNVTRHAAYNRRFWTPTRNKYAGNIGIGEGSVWEVNSDELQSTIKRTGLVTNRLAIP